MGRSYLERKLMHHIRERRQETMRLLRETTEHVYDSEIEDITAFSDREENYMDVVKALHELVTSNQRDLYMGKREEPITSVEFDVSPGKLKIGRKPKRRGGNSGPRHMRAGEVVAMIIEHDKLHGYETSDGAARQVLSSWVDSRDVSFEGKDKKRMYNVREVKEALATYTYSK